jgi:pyridoxamine 5'-phosphate oxidase
VPIPARALHAHDLDPDPLVQFRRWFADAEEHGQLQPDAMVVATSTPDGHPSARMVLLRGIDDRGFWFFTNFESRKGSELAANPRVALVLHWPEVLRQVRATGRAERLTDAESDAYWYARPRASQVSAWASAQSQPITTREELEARASDLETRFADVDVLRPDAWGGYRVTPDEIEFWQHRDDRLHDRFVYTRDESGDAWNITRLQP